MKTLILAAALAAIATPAFAEDWRLVSTNPEKTAAFLIDVDSNKPGTGGRTVRVLMVLEAGAEQFDAVETTNIVDCNSARHQVGPGKAYDATGKVIAQDTDTSMRWEDVAPGSNYANVNDVVCGRRAVPADSYKSGVPVSAVRAALIAAKPR